MNIKPNTRYDLASYGNGLMDLLAHVEEQTIAELGLRKGTMLLVDDAKSRELLVKLAHLKWKKALGGSALNTLRISALLGLSNYFVSMVGDDDLGREMIRQLDNINIVASLGKSEVSATGSVLSFVTPDGERTMATCLGASKETKRSYKSDVEQVTQAKMFHFTGYALTDADMRKAVLDAVKTVRKQHTLISFDVADAWVIEQFNEHIKECIRYASIVFMNRKEATTLANTVEEAIALCAQTALVVVVKLGKEGCIVHDTLTKTSSLVAGQPEDPVDTTGAGDCFAAGFLFGLIKELPYAQCAAIGNLLGAKVVRNMGTQLTKQDLREVRAALHKISPSLTKRKHATEA